MLGALSGPHPATDRRNISGARKACDRESPYASMAPECTESNTSTSSVSKSLRPHASVITLSTYAPDDYATIPPSFNAYRSPSPLIHPAFVYTVVESPSAR